jgi:hypothetical protein
MISKKLYQWRTVTRFCLEKPHRGLVWRDLRGLRHSPLNDEEHLAAAMAWLCRSQDETDDGGSSGGYYFESGWRRAYPETTGYIIPTFLEYEQFSGDRTFGDRARRMGDWEIRIQMPSGAVPGGHGDTGQPVVFNTGQVICGWTSLYRATRDPAYLEAAMRAADWLCSVQDGDGKWSRHTFKNQLHAYNTRVSWTLFEVAALSGRQRYQQAAERHVRWVLGLADGDGWIRHMGFHPSEPVYTHTIAYTFRGLLESAPFLAEDLRDRVVALTERAMEAIIDHHGLADKPGRKPRWLPGTLRPDWSGPGRYSCLTGNVQTAIVLMKLDDCLETTIRQAAADTLIDSVKAAHVMNPSGNGLHGGVAGSYPVWGGYKPWAILNWATKFLADALLLRLARRRPVLRTKPEPGVEDKCLEEAIRNG